MIKPDPRRCADKRDAVTELTERLEELKRSIPSVPLDRLTLEQLAELQAVVAGLGVEVAKRMKEAK